MKKLLLAAIVFVAGACTTGGTRHQQQTDEPPSSISPKFGRIVTLYEVLDQDTRERVGYVELTRYDSGQDIYWVRDKNRRDAKLGYILTNNMGYRYVSHAGRRSPNPEFIGADTISANARRILGYDHPVELQETSLEALARAIQSPPAQDSAGSGAEDAGDDKE